MNREWSERQKIIQMQLRSKETFPAGIAALTELRTLLMQTLSALRGELSPEDFTARPFPRANGCHSATVAYSVWHIFRIEDIVSHTLLLGDTQVFFRDNYKIRMNAPVITTGNELCGDAISEFSAKLHLDALYAYARAVKADTEKLLQTLSYADMKQKVSSERKKELLALGVVSTHPDAAWLVDYWCGKDTRRLIQMPFSRHWIMHTEACLRIAHGLNP